MMTLVYHSLRSFCSFGFGTNLLSYVFNLKTIPIQLQPFLFSRLFPSTIRVEIQLRGNNTDDSLLFISEFRFLSAIVELCYFSHWSLLYSRSLDRFFLNLTAFNYPWLDAMQNCRIENLQKCVMFVLVHSETSCPVFLTIKCTTS